MAEDLGTTPMSPALQATLMRAREYASSQSHLQVTVEHLLLALSEDEDAGLVLQSSQVDLNRLRNDVAGFLGSLGDRSSGGPTNPTVSPGLAEILKYATLAAKQGRRNRIDGAIVLAALVGDGRSMAASFLKAQGLTFEEAIRVLQRAAQAAPVQTALPARQPSAATPPPASSRAGSNAEDILAAARERVEQRTLPPRSELSVPAAARTATVRQAPKSVEILPPPAAAPAPDVPTVMLATAPVSRPVEQPVEPTETAPPALELEAQPPKLPEQPTQRPSSVLAELAPSRWDRLPQPAYPVPDVASPAAPEESPQRPAPVPRQPSSNWAPPPLPTPPAQHLTPQPRMPLPQPPARQPISGLTERLAERMPERAQQRPEPMAGAPWPDPTPRPPNPQPQMPGAPQMRAPAPMPSPGHQGPVAAQRQVAPVPAGLPGDAPRAPAIEAGQVSFTLPKRLRHDVPTTIEVRVARAPLAGSGSGPMPSSLRAEFVAVRAITVRLRGGKGAFAIEPGSPETQWDQATQATARAAGDAAVWRFTLTPLRGHSSDLQLMVAARTVGADGMIADTVLPDLVLPVKIARNLKRPLRRILSAAAIAFTSIVLWTVIEQVFKLDLWHVVQRLAGF